MFIVLEGNSEYYIAEILLTRKNFNCNINTCCHSIFLSDIESFINIYDYENNIINDIYEGEKNLIYIEFTISNKIIKPNILCDFIKYDIFHTYDNAYCELINKYVWLYNHIDNDFINTDNIKKISSKVNIYYSNGNLCLDYYQVNFKVEGELNTYEEDGNIIKKELYINGKRNCTILVNQCETNLLF